MQIVSSLSVPEPWRRGLPFRNRVRGVLLAATSVWIVAASVGKTEAGVSVWDTGAPVSWTEPSWDRGGWREVPSDLIALEAEPDKARSDPAYYGREYVFAGDAVVENEKLVAVFSSAQGGMSLYPKVGGVKAPGPDALPDEPAVGFVPFGGSEGRAGIQRVAIVRNAGDEAVLQVSFSHATGGASAVVAFDKSEIVEIRPEQEMERIRLSAALDYGIVPDFIGDDLIFDPGSFPGSEWLSLPAEHVFVGLCGGGSRMLVVTWPDAGRFPRLHSAREEDGRRGFDSVEFAGGGRALYLAVLEAPGIWHREELKVSYLEKEVPIPWKPPFPAKWQTQLFEGKARTTFAFRESAGQVWRGVPGMYRYPVWIEGDGASFFLSKKIPPRGESVIYFLEGQETPPDISTPVDIVKATLGRELSAGLLDVPGRKLRTHHRRGEAGVRRACTCGGTEAVQAIFEAGTEAEERPYIAGVMDDTVYFVEKHLERIGEYQRFAGEMLAFLRSAKNSGKVPEAFTGPLEEIAARIPEECRLQQENMKSLDHARALAGQTVALAGRKAPDNLKAYMELLQAWRAMGGAQDYVLALCHTVARTLSQEAGNGCAARPEALELAREIRNRCRRILRNADGYEIWANY